MMYDVLADKKYGYTHDANGNVGAMFDLATGEVVARYEYGPFGEPLRASGPMAQVNPFRWSSKYWENETGLVFYGGNGDNGKPGRGRYYNPTWGRWLSQDPLGDSAFFLHYTEGKSREEIMRLYEEAIGPSCLFVRNNPVNYFDPFGLAYFANGPLSALGGKWLGPFSMNPIDDFFNTELSHEHLFFEDGNQPANLGYGPDGLFSLSDTSKYHRRGPKYEDCTMRMAVEQVQWKGCDYKVVGHNCQGWAEAVRKNTTS